MKTGNYYPCFELSSLHSLWLSHFRHNIKTSRNLAKLGTLFIFNLSLFLVQRKRCQGRIQDFSRRSGGGGGTGVLKLQNQWGMPPNAVI